MWGEQGHRRRHAVGSLLEYDHVRDHGAQRRPAAGIKGFGNDRSFEPGCLMASRPRWPEVRYRLKRSLACWKASGPPVTGRCEDALASFSFESRCLAVRRNGDIGSNCAAAADCCPSALPPLGEQSEGLESAMSNCTTTAVISSERAPWVSACQRFRATEVIMRAAETGSPCLPAMFTASCDVSRSQTPSDPRMSTRSFWLSFRSTTSGWELTNGRRLRSPSDRDTASPP
mmetsp:Transcript_72865/g.202094  ORF Transcript_72865/g.202094 Transcript_72865/m.202094 type:complete len:230 (-) Transcript_72865:762-1451(-)